MARAGFHPEHISVARLSGFEIHLCPHACLTRSDRASVYGIWVKASHAELDNLYSRDGVGTFLPEAVLIEALDGGMHPAMCYVPPTVGTQPADIDYLNRLIAAAREYQFPDWYLKRLDSLR
jgi:hypothetical protein